MTTNNTSDGSLIKSLAKILQNVPNIPKTGYNSFHKYEYTKEGDLLNALRPMLAEEGIFVFSSIDAERRDEIPSDKGASDWLTTVTMTFTFCKGSESFAVQSRGTGADRGDKGLYKAITGATKYAFKKIFLISDEGDDPEADESTDRRSYGSPTATGSRGGRPPGSRNKATSAGSAAPGGPEGDYGHPAPAKPTTTRATKPKADVAAELDGATVVADFFKLVDAAQELGYPDNYYEQFFVLKPNAAMPPLNKIALLSKPPEIKYLAAVNAKFKAALETKPTASADEPDLEM